MLNKDMKILRQWTRNIIRGRMHVTACSLLRIAPHRLQPPWTNSEPGTMSSPATASSPPNNNKNESKDQRELRKWNTDKSAEKKRNYTNCKQDKNLDATHLFEECPIAPLATQRKNLIEKIKKIIPHFPYERTLKDFLDEDERPHLTRKTY